MKGSNSVRFEGNNIPTLLMEDSFYWEVVMQALVQEKAYASPVETVHTLFTTENMACLPIYSIRHLPDSFVLSHNLKDNIRNDTEAPSNPCQKQIHR